MSSAVHAQPTSRDGFFLFWSGWPSNWHASPFTLDGRAYGCVEQWMMWSKARYFADDDLATQIMRASSPRQQKELGRKVRNFESIAWSEVSRAIVYRGALQKFLQNESLRVSLLATEHQVIVEASPEDVIWGVGLAADHPDITNPPRWRGTNWLGEVLMRVRSTLHSQ